MNLPPTTPPPRIRGASDVALPAAVLSYLRKALRSDLDPLAATHLMYGAGYRAGPDVEASLVRELGGELCDVAESSFWDDLSTFFHRRGWGRLDAERVHPGLGMVWARDWAESSTRGDEAQPGCHFTCGLLAYLLGRAAGAPIAVLEVSCRSRGDEACGFLYGSEAAVHEIYGLLLEGSPLDRALSEL